MQIFSTFFIIITITFLLLTSCSNELIRDEPPVLKLNDEIKLTFQYDSNIIYLDVLINNRPSVFALDTGTGLNVISDKLAEELNLSKKDEILIRSVTGKGVKSYLTEISTLKMNGIKISDTQAIIADLSNINNMLTKKIDGLLGYNFIQMFQIRINYQTRSITFYHPDKILNDINTFNNLSIIIKKYSPYIKSFYNEKLWSEVLIDTGNTEPFFSSLTYNTANSLKLFSSNNKVIKVEGISGGDVAETFSETYITRLKSAEIQDFKFNKPIVRVSNAKANSFGNIFLENYEVIFNYRKNLMSLKRVTKKYSFEEPFYTLGLFYTIDNDKIIITGFYENSSSQKSGIKIGDQIIDINTISKDGKIEKLSSDRMTFKPNQEIIIKVLRNYEVLTFKLKNSFLL